MTRILQLTDLHVFSEPNIRLKNVPTRESLQDVVDHILATQAPFDHVVITGDHTHDELHASYQAVGEILSPWRDRLWQVPGNHDDRSVLRAEFSDRISGNGNDLIQFSFEAGDWLCVGLDTHLPGEVAGQITVEHIDWLNEKLSQSTASRVAMFFHHPPVDVGSEWMDRIGLNGRELLQDVIARDQRIRLISCGHVHHEFNLSLEQAVVLTAPSTGVQFAPFGEEPHFDFAAPGFRVIELTGAQFETTVFRLPEAKYEPIAD